MGRNVTAWWNRIQGHRFRRGPVPAGERELGGDGGRGRECHRKVLHPVDEVGLQVLHLATLANIGDPVEQALEHDLYLHAGQICTQAEVGTATTEGYVVVRGPADVELVGGLAEHRLVAVDRKST